MAEDRIYARAYPVNPAGEQVGQAQEVLLNYAIALEGEEWVTRLWATQEHTFDIPARTEVAAIRVQIGEWLIHTQGIYEGFIESGTLIVSRLNVESREADEPGT